MGGRVLVLVQGGGGACACACVSVFSGRLVSLWVLFHFELLLLPPYLTLASEATTPIPLAPGCPHPTRPQGPIHITAMLPEVHEGKCQIKGRPPPSREERPCATEELFWWHSVMPFSGCHLLYPLQLTVLVVELDRLNIPSNERLIKHPLRWETDWTYPQMRDWLNIPSNGRLIEHPLR